MFNKSDPSPDILKRHFGLTDLVSPTKKDKFDSDSESEDEEIGFDPPPDITPDLLSRTPVIRLTTPIRQRETKKREEEFDIPEVKEVKRSPIPTIVPSPKRSPLRSPTTPVIDLSDEDDINERVHELISFPGEQDYSKEPEKIKELCEEAYKIKFKSLSMNYPDRRIEYPEGKKLERVHKAYHSHIKSIYVDMNLDQIQLGYVMCLMAFEFVAIKAFGVPMAGFTKMEMKRMYRYNHLMIELGESLFPETGGGKGGGPRSPLEYRIATSFAWNVVIFLGLKFLSKYLGGESMTGVVRGAIDKMLDNPITVDNIEDGTATGQQEGMDGMFEGLVTGGGTDLTEILANIGTNFTQKMENKNGEKKTKKKKRRVIFNE